MKKRVYLLATITIALLIPTGLVVAVEAQRTPDWLYALHTQTPYAVPQAVRARQPGEFTMQMDYPAVGPGRFQYMVTDAYGEQHIGILALPYPPRAVRCVLVTYKGGVKALFVNFYSDTLWNQGWVVHEGPDAPFDAAFRDDLARLGCDLAW